VGKNSRKDQSGEISNHDIYLGKDGYAHVAVITCLGKKGLAETPASPFSCYQTPILHKISETKTISLTLEATWENRKASPDYPLEYGCASPHQEPIRPTDQ